MEIEIIYEETRGRTARKVRIGEVEISHSAYEVLAALRDGVPMENVKNQLKITQRRVYHLLRELQDAKLVKRKIKYEVLV